MRIGYFLSSEEFDPRALVRQAEMAEQAGFEGLWISDHFHPWNDAQGQAVYAAHDLSSTAGTVTGPGIGMTAYTAVAGDVGLVNFSTSGQAGSASFTAGKSNRAVPIVAVSTAPSGPSRKRRKCGQGDGPHPKALLLDLGLERVGKIFGDVFGRGVHLVEGRKVVQELMVQAVGKGFDRGAHVDEVDQQAGRVERGALDGDPEPVVMAVDVLTFSLVVAQGVAGSKCVIDRDFVH